MVPLLTAYEVGVSLLGDRTARTGADAWVRHVLSGLGLEDRWLLPLSLILVLLSQQAVAPRAPRTRPIVVAGMAFESVVLAFALLGLNKLLDALFLRLDELGTILALSPGTSADLASIIAFVGAGVYEESLFRLFLIPLLYRACRGLQASGVLAGTLAVTGSSVLFSMAHHLGLPSEAFSWYAFVFRWLAGVVFAGVFLMRGFGIAVGTHVTYDLLVGWLDWHF